MSDARRAAHRALRTVAEGGRADDALDAVLPGVDPRDRGFVHRLVYGTLRLRGRLDHLLGLHVHRGLGRVDPEILDVLRAGVYQLREMDAVPEYAAVSESVELAAEVSGGGAGGFVNGVLRALLRGGTGRDRFPALEDDPAAHLSTWGSHPRWLVERWLDRGTVEEVAGIVAAGNREPPVFLRPVGVDAGEAVRRLREAGVAAEPVGRGTGCLRLEGGGRVDVALDAVPAVVQDPGAALVASFVAPPPGARIADLCAAPGGKAVALAAGGRALLAGDRSPGRLRLVRENARRTGVRVLAVAADAARPPLREADVVLLDVPCTGTGTLRRNPDLRWRLGPEDPGRMARVQEGILEGAAPAVAPDGLLVYSTCSLEPEENGERISGFLRRHPEFEAAGPGPVPAEFIDADGTLRVRPTPDGFDGAYAARLRRTE